MEISIVIPYLSSSDTIAACKKYLEKNTFNKFELIEIIDQSDVYSSYNEGVNKASNEIIIMMNDDMIVSKNWDANVIKYSNNNLILTFNVIEPENMPVNPKNIIFNAGRNIYEFDYDKFREKCNDVEENNPEILYDVKGWYMPIVWHKSSYIPYPNKRKFPYPNDIELIDLILPKKGRKFAKLNNCIYHFQGSSHKNNNINEV